MKNSLKADRKKVAIAMAKACISAKELGEKTGLGLNTVKTFTAGKTVRPCTFGMICKALGVEVEELLESEV